MGKPKYKEVSPELEALVKPKNNSKSRSSLGKEELVNEYYYLKLDDLIPYENQARRVFDEVKIMELANSIKEYGIRQPLTVKISELQEGKYEVVSGERRLRAAKIASLERVPCIILEEKKNEYDEIALVENVQRKDLHPIELSDALHKLIDKKSYGDVKYLAEKLGISYSGISEILKLSKLPDKVKQFLLSKDIKSRAIFRSLLKCKNEDDMMNMLGLNENNSDIVVARSRNVIHITSKLGKLDIKCDYRRLNDQQKADLKEKLHEILGNL